MVFPGFDEQAYPIFYDRILVKKVPSRSVVHYYKAGYIPKKF